MGMNSVKKITFQSSSTKPQEIFVQVLIVLRTILLEVDFPAKQNENLECHTPIVNNNKNATNQATSSPLYN